MRDEQIAELIAAAGNDPDAAAEALVAAANRAGGIDNITVVLFEIARGRARARVPSPAAAEPDEDTMEQAAESPATRLAPRRRARAAPRRRRRAAAGSRSLAIVLTVAVAALVVWWSLGR